MDYSKAAIEKHREWRGKLETVPKMKVENRDDLSIAYTPGVAAPCLEIRKNPEDSYVYTGRGNTVAVISDGSAVLGLGNIGPEAGMPVMEGKCVLFKSFAGINAVPLVLNTQDTDELVDIICALEPSFGGINLEDISAPRCFEVERRCKERMNIPVFHDDQHGTAVVVCSALVNALRLVGKEDPDIVILGAGSAGIAIAKLILSLNLGNVIMCGRNGILTPEMDMNEAKKEIAAMTNRNHKTGSLQDALKGADVFIGVSAPHVVTKEMIAGMNPDAIVFPMANPIPEIEPQDALEAGARVVGTGRSDYPNQINNVLCFPGMFKGALEAGAREINEDMKKAAVYALADLVSPEELKEDYVIVAPFDPRVADHMAAAVAEAARKSGVVRRTSDNE